MTQKEHVEAVLAAYRQGYRDGMGDKPTAPEVVYPAQAAAIDETAFEAFNQSIANLMMFDGTAQEPVEKSLARTRQR